MRRALAQWVNSKAANVKSKEHAGAFYRVATLLDPSFSSPWYNLGLQAKYAHDWAASLRLNKRAYELDPSDLAACWNLGIAATALKDWSSARKAWENYGITVLPGSGEVQMERIRGCVRLNPDSEGEVVFGHRIDPARLLILNVPLPESNHRYADIVLHDGAPNGSRLDGTGSKVDVFDELELWRSSNYSTYSVALRVANEESLKQLVEICKDPDVGIEDWSTIRMICKVCSEGFPDDKHRHEHREKGEGRFGFGAVSKSDVERILNSWSGIGGEVLSDITLELAA